MVVTGPDGYSQTVTTTTTLKVPPGTYSIAVSEARGSDSIVPQAFDGSATPTSVTVAANDTATTTVSYALRPGSGMLWIPQWGGSYQAVGLARSQLLASGSPTPDVSLMGTTNHGEGIAFDGEGNMWVSDIIGYLYRYDAASLASSGTPAPAVTIDATAYGGLVGLAFDASGNLWTADFWNNRLLGYSPAQLTADGAPTPSVVISANGSSLSRPVAVSFDGQGNLWVANRDASTVVSFSPAQLTATGTPAPTVTLNTSGGSLESPYAMAFDAGGNLWVSNISATVVRFDAAQLTSSGNPTPAATIDHSSLGNNPLGLAFDANGALWVGDADTATSNLRRFANPGALVGSVSPTAGVVITDIGLTDGMLMAFSPPPANLPINTP
ncbi:MAG TPA: NHL repeat-containing protein [Trueperaceae bacterium]|nr:NHL repeat-containing protein [Trueperaceae bacterium]